MTLHLTLKKKWFDMILTGQKMEEYRDIKMFWAVRLMNGFPRTYGIDKLNPDFKNFTEVQFTHGYAKSAPTALLECKGIEIGRTKGEWSDDAEKEVFVIKLGRLLFHKNCG